MNSGYKKHFDISNMNSYILNYKHDRAKTKYWNRKVYGELKSITEERLTSKMPLIYRYSIRTKQIALPPVKKSTCEINNCNLNN